MIKNSLKKFLIKLKQLHNQKTLFYVFLALLMLPNVILAITETFTPLERVCSIVLPLGIYYLIVTLTKRLGWSIFALFPISLLAGLQVVLLYLYGRSVVATDMFLNFVTTDKSETSELLSNILGILLFVVLLYIPPIIYAIIGIYKSNQLTDKFMRNNRLIAIGIAIAGFFLLAFCYVASEGYSIKKDVYPLNACYNMYKAVDRHDKLRNYKVTSKHFKFNSKSTHDIAQREIYVVVLGETSRANNWELYGYNRETNPKLKSIDSLIVFKRVLSEANITHKCVPMLMSSASAKDFDKIYSQKGIITAFKEAGFKTAFYSNQAHTQTLGDLFGEEADECVYLRDNNEIKDPLDGQLVDSLKKEVAKGAKKQLIVLHTYGSHFNYSSRYPAQSAYYKPDKPIAANKKHYEPLINAYDNSIRYTDEVLYEIIKYLDGLNDVSSSMIYVSDHGEALFDHGEDVVFHSSTSPSFYHLHVPMIMWFSKKYTENHSQIITNLKSNTSANVSSCASLFHTVLNISGIETIYREDSYSLASELFIERPYVYLNDQYNGVPILNVDMRKVDYELLDKFINQN